MKVVDVVGVGRVAGGGIKVCAARGDGEAVCRGVWMDWMRLMRLGEDATKKVSLFDV